MNLAKAAEAIDAATDALAKSNRDAKMVAEKRFEYALRSYIDNEGRRYAFGGLCNLLTTLATICEERAQRDGDDYDKAMIALESCAAACDLKYPEIES